MNALTNAIVSQAQSRALAAEQQATQTREVSHGIPWSDIQRGMPILGWWGNGDINGKVHNKYEQNGHYFIEAAMYGRDSKYGGGKDIWCDIYEVEVRNAILANPIRHIGSTGSIRGTSVGFDELEKTMLMEATA